MKYGLGIDTGGTYTDAVIFDFDRNTILSTAKSLTVKENLEEGIHKVLDELPQELLQQVRVVSLSTTLATNACVEGKGARATLVFIGCDPDTVKANGPKYGLNSHNGMIFLDGGHNQQGDVIREPDWDELKLRVEEFRDHTDSFVVIQMWGMRNPEFEKKAKQLIQEWTGLPVLCAYELTGQLNFLKRAATALLNAQLIPIIKEFTDAMRQTLTDRGIHAPIAMVRGDGSLMSEEFARERPIETLVSGPASSVAGGIRLSGSRNCIIADMGGTTTDLAIVQDGRVSLAEEGISVGNWKVGAKSIRMRTIGLGGDSRIILQEDGTLKIGPRRVAPVSWLASRWPDTLQEMKRITAIYAKHSVWLLEFFYLVRDPGDGPGYSEQERHMIQALRKGPLSIPQLSDALEISVYELKTHNLEKQGIIMRSGLTPTDIMHLTGEYQAWSKEAASLCAGTMAAWNDCTVEELAYRVQDGICRKLYYHITEMLLQEEEGNMAGGYGREAQELIMMGYRREKDTHKFIRSQFSTGYDLVGIGAPIHVFLPQVADNLSASCIIPPDAGVANAIGTVTGDVVVEEVISLRPRLEVFGISGYICHSSRERMEFKEYPEALEWAKTECSRIAMEIAEARGARGVELKLEVRDCFMHPSIPGKPEKTQSEDMQEEQEAGEKSKGILLETLVTARAAGSLGEL